MKTTTTKVSLVNGRQAVVSVVLLGCLSGCLATDAPTKPSVMQQIQQQEIKDTLDTHVAEFKKIKPSIERLIAMENDFKVMVSQIAKINNPGTPTENLTQFNTYDPQEQSVALDPHNPQPELEVLYVSDTALEPEPIFPIEPVSPVELKSTDSVVTFQAAEPVLTTTSNASITSTTSNASTTSPQRIAQVRLFPETSYTTCAPLGVTSDARKYGIHVASYNTLDSLPRGWHESVQRFPDFCQKGAVIQKVVVKNKEFYSMRVGPYVSRSEAKSICYALKKQKQYCRVTDFTGETL